MLYGKLRPYLDKAVLAEWEGVCSTDILVLEPKPNETDSAFLSFLLHSPDFLAHAIATTSGVNHPRTDWNSVAAYEQPIPSPPEQRAIAGILSTLQYAVEHQDRIVATLKELKAATMAKLFREGLRGEPLKQTEIGEIPESWDVVPLGNVFEIQQGKALSPGARRGMSPRPFLRTSNVLWGRVDLTEVDSMDFSPEEASRLSLAPGDLLVCEGGEIGRTAMWALGGTSYSFQNHIHRLRRRLESVEPAFFMHWMETAFLIRRLYAGHGNRTTIPNLSASRLRELPVPLASPFEQREMARAVTTVASRTEWAAQRASALRASFDSMLSLLMTGRVRLPSALLHAVFDQKASRAVPPASPLKVGTKSPDRGLLDEIVKRIVEAVAPEKIILFGSAARGEMGPDSDLDLLVVKPHVHRLKTAQAIERGLRGIPFPTDILVAWPEDLERHRDTIGLIYRPALKEGKTIYAA